MIFVLIMLGEGIAGVVCAASYKGHRYPVEVIPHCVWLHFRFPAQLP
jgi:putative transposase